MSELGIAKLKDKLQILADLRNGYLHFNHKKLAKQSSRRNNEDVLPTTDELEFSVYAYDSYQIMQKLLRCFYSKQKKSRYIKECLMDFDKRKSEILKENIGISPEFNKAYLEKKKEAIIKQIKQGKNAKK